MCWLLTLALPVVGLFRLAAVAVSESGEDHGERNAPIPNSSRM